MVGVGMTEPLLRCLRTPGVNIEALNDVLEKIAGHSESFKTTRCVTYSWKPQSRYVVKSQRMARYWLKCSVVNILSRFSAWILRLNLCCLTVKAHLIPRFKANNTFRGDMPDSPGDEWVSKSEERYTTLLRSASPPPRTWSVDLQHLFSTVLKLAFRSVHLCIPGHRIDYRSVWHVTEQRIKTILYSVWPPWRNLSDIWQIPNFVILKLPLDLHDLTHMMQSQGRYPKSWQSRRMDIGWCH